MKKSMKKQLLLVVMIVALVVVATLTASATTVTEAYCSKCGKTVPYTYGTIFDPQCESEGYTQLVCIYHNDVEVGKANVKPALGHALVTRDYTIDELGTYYQNNQKCTRLGCQYGVSEDKPELDDEAEEVRYCKVRFIDDFVADEFESEEFCPYAKLAMSYKTEIETIYVKFPEEGVTVVSSSKQPFRYPDRAFGEYRFVGWLSDDEIAELAANSITTSTFNLRHDTSEILTKNREFDSVGNRFIYNAEDNAYYDSLVDKAAPNLKGVDVTPLTSANYDLYAIFEVETDYKHTVEFYNYDGTLLFKKEGVSHAIDNVVYNSVEPIRIPNVEYIYTFDHWNLFGTSKRVSVGHKIGPVYGDLKVVADYGYELKTYEFRYCLENDDGELEPIKIDGQEIIDVVTIAGFEGDRKNADLGTKLDIDTDFDAAYYYVHTGKWIIPSRGNYVVDLKNITLPQGTLNNSIIDLVPQYQQYTRMYKLVVKILYTQDNNYHPKNIKLQVVNAEGKGVGYAEVDQSEKYYKDGIYTVVFDVAYSKNYKVTATSTGYVGEGSTQFREYDPTDPDDDTPGQIIVTMEQPEEEPCNCICHTVFKPVWVGILKLLNSLFKLEFVCCDDMFANIGGDLNYGPGVSK